MLQIKPEELFFIGRQMNAQYIDYEYISMMKDIQEQFSLKEKEVMNHLVEKGLFMEDFSGNLTLDEETEKMLQALFFGEFETECVLGEKSDEGFATETYKYHFYEDRITQVKVQGDTLYISENGKEGLEGNFQTICPDNYHAVTKNISEEEIKLKEADGIILLNNMRIGHSSMTCHLARVDGIWYVEEEDKIKSLSKEDLIILWEKMTGRD